MNAFSYYYYWCFDCEWDCVVHGIPTEDLFCPLCAADNGRDVRLLGRPARPSDHPEGRDARKVGQL